MRVVATSLPEVLLIEPAVFRDARGMFREWFNEERYAALGLPTRFRQDNHARSVRGVLRGLHFQQPRAQGKLVTVVRGMVYDVAVDIRMGSPTFGRWCGVTLTGDEPSALWVPPGFAHGYCVLSDGADVVYKCTEVYVPADDRCVRWDDPTVAIEWPIADPIVSDKDRTALLLADLHDHLPRYGT